MTDKSQKSQWLQKNKNLFLFSLGSGFLGWIGLVLLSFFTREVHNIETFLSIFQGDALIISIGVFVSFFIATIFLVKLFYGTSRKAKFFIFPVLGSILIYLLLPTIQNEYQNYQDRRFYKLKNSLKEATKSEDIKNIIAQISNEYINRINFGSAIGSNIICTKDLSILEQLKEKGYNFKLEYSIGIFATHLLDSAITNQCYHKTTLQYLLDNSQPSDRELSELTREAALREENLPAFKQLIQYQSLTKETHWYFIAFYFSGSIKTDYGKKRIKPQFQKYVNYLAEVVPLNENIMRDGEEINPLSIAITNGDAQFVKTLLDKGANVNQEYSNEYNSRTNNPLQMALNLWQLDIAKLLIEAGAEVNQPINASRVEYPNQLSYFLQRRYSTDKPICKEIVNMLVKRTHNIDKKSLKWLKEIQ